MIGTSRETCEDNQMSKTLPPTETETETLAAYEAALAECGVGVLALVRADSEWAERLMRDE